MNGGPDAPTTADYANSSAQDAMARVQALEYRVKALEQALVSTLVILSQKSATTALTRATALREVRATLEQVLTP